MEPDEPAPRNAGILLRLRKVSFFTWLLVGLFSIAALAMVLVRNRPAQVPQGTLNFPLPPPVLSPEERSYLERLGPVPFCVDSDWEPYEQIDESGNYRGIAADLVRLIAARSGVDLRLLPTRDWGESLAASRSGACLILAFLNETPERGEWLIFTEPYFSDPNVFITGAKHDFITDLDRFAGSSIVFPEGTSLEEKVRKRYPSLRILVTDSEGAALRMVEEGKADMTLRSLTMAAYTIRKEGFFNLRISGQLPDFDNKFRMGIVKNEPLLRDILNRGVRSVTPQEVRAVVNAHISIEARTVSDYRPLIWLSGAFLIVSIGWVSWNLSLRRHTRHLRLIIDTVPAFIFAKDRKGRYLLANRWMASAFGVSPEKVEGLTDRECHATEEQMAAFLEQDRKVLESGQALHIDGHPGRRVDGSPGWFQTIKVPYRRPGSKGDAILGVTVDITDLKRAGLELEEREKRFKHMAQHDGLTDLPNRALFSDRLNQAMALCRREKTKLALAFVDLDRFKEVNDSLGHEAGDSLLREAARRMRTCVRASDTVGRIGGDEFVIFLRGVEDRKAAGLTAGKIREALELPFEIAGKRIGISASIGIAIFPDDSEDETALSRRADAAMYRAKAEGRNRVSVFDPLLDDLNGSRT